MKWLESTKRRLTMLVDGTLPVAWDRIRTEDAGESIGCLPLWHGVRRE